MKKNIYIVDDDKDILTIAKYCLDDVTDFNVFYLTSGQDALKKAIEQKPDLVVLDIMMPGMDGIATLQALRMIPDLATVPVIFLTAKAQPSEVSYYLSLGVKGVIIKPFDPLTLKDQLQQYL